MSNQNVNISQEDERAQTIAVLVLPGTTASVVYGMFDLFLAAGRDWPAITNGEPGPELIHALLINRCGRPVDVCNGVTITPHLCLEECPSDAVICVPEVNHPPGEPLMNHYPVEISWLRRRYAEGSTLAAACSGAMLFAEAGLLDGEAATTHWAWCDDMRQRFPGIRVCDDQALVVSGEGQRLIMAGGGTSFLDLALYLIARTCGVDSAMQVARVNLIDWHTVGQQPFASLACTRQVKDAIVTRCQAWVAEHYREPHPVAAMQRLSGLAGRTFTRRFQLATGMAPMEYVHALRVEEAKYMLEIGNLPSEAIANEVGYEDAGYFGKLFRKKVGLTPMQYRRRFGHMRHQLSM